MTEEGTIPSEPKGVAVNAGVGNVLTPAVRWVNKIHVLAGWKVNKIHVLVVGEVNKIHVLVVGEVNKIHVAKGRKSCGVWTEKALKTLDILAFLGGDFLPEILTLTASTDIMVSIEK